MIRVEWLTNKIKFGFEKMLLNVGIICVYTVNSPMAEVRILHPSYI